MSLSAPLKQLRGIARELRLAKVSKILMLFYGFKQLKLHSVVFNLE